MKKITVTGHCVIKNEDQFVWFAISSVLPHLDKLLIYDTGSVDKTVEIIKSFKSRKIVFEEKGSVTPDQMTALRNEQIKKTTTDFFFILDGDEIWPKNSLKTIINQLSILPKEKLAIFCRTRNAVGDVYHFLPESAGRYHLAGIIGNLNIRIFRNIDSWKVVGTYPLEAYTYHGSPVNDLPEKLQFVDVWYLHCSFLRRSSIVENPKFKYELGVPQQFNELPEVFLKPPKPMSKTYWLRSLFETPLRHIKRKIL